MEMIWIFFEAGCFGKNRQNQLSTALNILKFKPGLLTFLMMLIHY